MENSTISEGLLYTQNLNQTLPTGLTITPCSLEKKNTSSLIILKIFAYYVRTPCSHNQPSGTTLNEQSVTLFIDQSKTCFNKINSSQNCFTGPHTKYMQTDPAEKVFLRGIRLCPM